MTLLPVVGRELRVAVRRRSTFWIRVLAASGATLLGAWVLFVQGDWQGGASAGKELFDWLAGAALLFGVLAGPVFTADTVSRERREGTLGLLFLTDLKGYDVVLGKLAAASLTAVLSILAILPVLAIPLLLGGVGINEFVRMALVLVNTLLLSLAIGMVVSAYCREAGSAVAMTVFVLFLLYLVVPWLQDVVSEGGQLVEVRQVMGWILRAINPGEAIGLADQVAKPGSPDWFWLALLASHLEVWVALAWAGWRTRSDWAEAGGGHGAGRWGDLWRTWNLGNAVERRRLRSLLLDRNPLIWLGGRHVLKRQALGWFGGVVAGVAIWIPLFSGSSWWTWEFSGMLLSLVQVPFKLLMASEASVRWLEDRRSGALELLVTSPLTVDEIIRGHFEALRRMFQIPVVAMTSALIGVAVMSAIRPDSTRAAWSLLLVNSGLFAWDLYTLGWVGLWQGLVQRRPGRASTAGIVRVLVLPWSLLLGTVFIVGGSAINVLPWLWLLIGGGVNLFWQRVCSRRVRASLRTMAMERPTVAVPRHRQPD